MNGKIYTIKSKETDLMYIGSTFEPLSKVLIRHKEEYKWYLRGRFTDAHPFELVKYEDAYIELLEDYPCENEKQLRKRKEELIRENKCVNTLKLSLSYQGLTPIEFDCLCECGACIRKGYKTQHLKTKKHLKWVGNNRIIEKAEK
jgi:hypothetical protein